MGLVVVVVGVQVGGRALPTIFPMQYTMQSGALAGRRQLSNLRLILLLLSFPSFPYFFSSWVSFSLPLSTIPPSFLPFSIPLPVVFLSAVESRQLLLVMTLSRHLLCGTITSLETLPFSLPSITLSAGSK